MCEHWRGEKLIKVFLALMIVIGALFVFNMSSVHAEELEIKQVDVGVSYTLDDEGNMVIVSASYFDSIGGHHVLIERGGLSGSSEWDESDRQKIKSIRVADGCNPVYLSNNAFKDFPALEYFDGKGFYTVDYGSINGLFMNCTELKTVVNVSDWDVSNLSSCSSMFEGCTSLTSVDLSDWRFSSYVKCSSMFANCTSLVSVNVNWPAENARRIETSLNMFQNCISLKSLDLSNWVGGSSSKRTWGGMFSGCENLEFLNMENVSLPYYSYYYVDPINTMFDRCYSLKKIVLGENFSFIGDNSAVRKLVLPSPLDATKWTGKWIREDLSAGPYYADELAELWTSENVSWLAGTWVWEPNVAVYRLKFVASSNVGGSMPNVSANIGADYVLPKNSFVKYGWVFDHWDDGLGHIYGDRDTIPANTYQMNDEVVLTAVFVKRNTFVSADDGEFAFDLEGGGTASFDDIPGNTQYQVWEETPDGWQLVQDGNTSGRIPSESTATVAYRNNYNPELAQVTLVGQKRVIDSSGVASYPVENQYAFTLTETTGGSSVSLQEIRNSDGGIVRFDPIELNSVSTHTYEIREVAGGNGHMDYDSHIETVTVRVTDNGSGLLTSEITTDSDGIVFTNYLNDRGSLKLTKIANDETGNSYWNDGETFSFDIMFRDKYDSVPSDAYGTYFNNEASAKGWTYDNATGVMTVVLNENKQSVVIENIPYGLQYSIQENLSDSSLYELTDSTGETGVISETQSEAVFVNTFKTVPTSVMLMAYKTADFDLENGQFEFELLNADKSKVLQRVSNGDLIEDGKYAGKAPVVFDSIPITEVKDYVYYIREKVESNDEYVYDDQLIKVTVHVVNDHGYLKANVSYEEQLAD